MSVIYQPRLPGSQQFYDLFETTGWNEDHPVQQDEIYNAISNSWYVVSAYMSDHLVGFGRVISDGVYHALIVEMIVHPDFQNRGIGSQILKLLLRRC